MLIKARSDSAADIQRVAEFPRDRNYLCGNAVIHCVFAADSGKSEWAIRKAFKLKKSHHLKL